MALSQATLDALNKAKEDLTAAAAEAQAAVAKAAAELGVAMPAPAPLSPHAKAHDALSVIQQVLNAVQILLPTIETILKGVGAASGS